jgi:hypothetical protein
VEPVAAPAPKVRRLGSAQSDISLNMNASIDGLEPSSPSIGKVSAGKQAAPAPRLRSRNSAPARTPLDEGQASVDGFESSNPSLGKGSPINEAAPAPKLRRRDSAPASISLDKSPAPVDERKPSHAAAGEISQKAAEQEREKKADKDSTSKESSSHPYLDRMKKKLKDGAERVLTAFDKRLVKPFNETFEKYVEKPILKPVGKVLKPIAKLIKAAAKVLAVAMVFAAKLLNGIWKIAFDIGANTLNIMMPHLVPGVKKFDTYGQLSKLFRRKKKDPADKSKDGEPADNEKQKKENETQENKLPGRNENAENYLLTHPPAH